MRILLLGAGRMGRAIAYDLLQHEEVTALIIADRERKHAEALVEWLADRRATAMRLDVSAPRAAREAMNGCAVAVSAVPYFFNFTLAQAAVEARVNFCDLGGNPKIVAEEFGLDDQAKQAGVTLIPDCGLAPGLVNILAAAAVEALGGMADSVRIRVGGLPQHPRPPLDYQIVFSPYGLINEYMEEATILHNGEPATVPSLTGLEEISFPPPYERLEAFHTAGGSSTLPLTMRGRVKDLDYKTIRYPGHLAKVKAIADLGFFDREPREIDGVEVAPRALAVRLFQEKLSFDEPDVVLLRVTARRGERTVGYEMVDLYDPRTGLSAMMRTTGFPIAEIAYMLGTREITARGVLPQEECVPHQEFITRLVSHGLKLERTVSE